MDVSAIPTFMSDHPAYATTFADEIAALEKAQAAAVSAGNALRDAREAQRQATADRIAGKRNAPHADQMDALVAAAEDKARGWAGASNTAYAALTKAVHTNHDFAATAALDYIRDASNKIAAALPVIEEFSAG